MTSMQLSSCCAFSALPVYYANPTRTSCSGLTSGRCIAGQGYIARTHEASTRIQQIRRQPIQTSRWKNRSYGRQSASAVSADPSTSEPIDIVAEVQTEKILILGGNGFVGTAIAKAAIGRGIEVISLSRSGRPTFTDPWVDEVVWEKGDVFSAEWAPLLKGVVSVISCIGGFGTNAQMERINGDANITAVEAASEAGVERFVLVSVHDYNLPAFLLDNGYFKGKRRAEKAVLDAFPTTGVILRPGVIHGTRRVYAANRSVDVPLSTVFAPLEDLLAAAESVTKPLASLPASDLLLAPPVSVEALAAAALRGAAPGSPLSGFVDIQAIKKLAKEGAEVFA
eukprot:TRINITY_DN11227_c0_g1_i1.p1 TRINITY_DN11227_c0_g1~~TRINITY_DN11227_c0_g1_i1.p1  ORF type:complete len:339 (-),score=36.86 TRINITY_DN11227_c0_g1_i1:169-1185(-)